MINKSIFHHLTSIIVILFQLNCEVNGNRSYSITAPEIIRPNEKYNVIVSLNGVLDTTQVTCTLQKTNSKLGNSSAELKLPKTFKPSESSTQLFEFQTGLGWTDGEYKLTVEGSGVSNFLETIPVKYVYKQFVILVQSDKAIYKPGQNVQFRILVLDFTLRPVFSKDVPDMKIFIMDPDGNRLQMFSLDNNQLESQINKFSFSKGVTNDLSFSLHERAKQGAWTIQASIHGQIQNYTFYVDHYVLPLANVTITVPKEVFYDNTTFEYKIDCFYTFGKPVRGNVKIIMNEIEECGKKVILNDDYSEDHPIDGQFSSKKDLRDTKFWRAVCSHTKVNVTAIITDSVTNSIYSSYEIFDIYKSKLIAKLLSKQNYFKPGKTVRIKSKIEGLDGMKLNNSLMESIKVEVQLTDIKNKNKSLIISKIIRYENYISFDFETNNETKSLYFIISTAEKLVLVEHTMQALTGCKDKFIQVMIQEPLKNQVVGETVKLIVLSNVPIKNLIYYIVVRGSVINQSQIVVNEEKNIMLPILVTREMVPEIIIAVYSAVENSSLILSDALTLYVSGLYHNEVKLNVKTPIVDASQKAGFTIEAETGSDLFVLGIDQAVLALKRGNDIYARRVLSELQYETQKEDFSTGFLQSGMIFRSNAEKECKTYYELEIFKDDEEIEQNKVVKIRKDFRETWLWDKVSISHGKTHINLASKVPDSITSWELTAFALHEEKGLGLTQIPGHFFRPFFVKLNLPYSIKRGEKSELHVLAFNYLNSTADVEVTVGSNNTVIGKEFELEGCSFKLKMKNNEIKTLTCFITAHDVGKFYLSAQAKAQSNSPSKTFTDGELRQILVVYEGITKQASKTVLFDFTKTDSKEIEDKIIIEYPKNMVNGSQKIYASATSELITTTWKDSLNSTINSKTIKANVFPPHACCQQRLVTYYPQVYLLDFLKASRKNTTEITLKAEELIQKAINWLCFQNPPDGSFVSWEWHTGETTDNNNIKAKTIPSSTWQTAYSLTLMNRAKYHVNVDQNHIINAKNWLIDQQKQKQTGEFIESDVVRQVTATTNFPAYLTSFVYIALNSDPETPTPNENAIKFLANSYTNLTHPLDYAITCYALHLGKYENRDDCFSKVLNTSKYDGVMRYWTGVDNQPDLMITAYNLMTLVNRKSNSVANQVLKFLISRQLEDGFFIDVWTPKTEWTANFGVSNSLVTVICIEAMTQFITTLESYDPKLESIQIEFNDNHEKQNIHLKPENEVKQSIELNDGIKEVVIKAFGYGRALARVYWEYNVNENSGKHIDITANKTQNSGDDHINIDVCARYNSGHVKNAIIEIDLPSGYTYDRSHLKNISETIDHIEYTNSETHVNVYLRELTKDEVCVSIPAIQNFKVSNIKPIPIRAYPYYDRSKETIHHLNI